MMTMRAHMVAGGSIKRRFSSFKPKLKSRKFQECLGESVLFWAIRMNSRVCYGLLSLYPHYKLHAATIPSLIILMIQVIPQVRLLNPFPVFRHHLYSSFTYFLGCVGLHAQTCTHHFHRQSINLFLDWRSVASWDTHMHYFSRLWKKINN